MTDEQQKVVDEWGEKICGDGAGFVSCHRLQRFHAFADYTGKNRQDDLRQTQKTSLEACFNSSLSNTDKELIFAEIS